MRRSYLVVVLASAWIGGCAIQAYGADGADEAAGATDPLTGNAPEPPSGLPASTPRCRTDLGPELARLAVPGVSAGIVKNGKLVCTAVAGLAQIEEKRPVTPDTVFTWASVSKAVTAVTLMTLVDEGKLGLDDPINDALPFDVTVPTCPGTPITFRHLLTHTSSITEDESDAYDEGYVPGDSPVALGAFLEDFLVPGGAHFARTNFEEGCPGTIGTYSNIGAATLGFLAETIAKRPFDLLARERVFLPLGMSETSFRLKDLDRSHLAMPYERTGTSFVAAGHQGFPTYPDGALRTSVPQMARFLAMFQQGGELEGTRILQKATVEEMKRVQAPAIDPDQGLIWFQSSFEGRPHVIGHDGDDPGISSSMFFDPADGAGVLLVANGNWKEAPAEALIAKLFAEAKVP